MWRAKEAHRYMRAFIGTFLFYVIFCIAMICIEAKPDHPVYLYMIPQISCFLIVSCWLLTVQSRIFHKTIKYQMYGIGGFFLLYCLLQMCRYCLFAEDVAISRHMWYGYYVPMTMIPVLIFYILHRLSSPADSGNGNGKAIRLFTVPALFICIGFLTNDFHQRAFGITDWETDSTKGRTMGPIYYMYVVFMAILLLLCLRKMFRMYRNRRNKKYLGCTLIPIILGLVYIALYTFKPEWVKVNGRTVLNLSEIFAFMTIGFMEVCIQIGLIPSNMSYRRLFSLSEVSARVLDYDGETVYETQSAEGSFEETDDYRIVSQSVKGGNFLYGIDFGKLNRLNEELDEITTNLESRNDLLRYENEIVLERKRPEEAARIYDSISELVRPQILEVKELLSTVEDEEDRFRDRLVRSAVLNAYIKRRSNMELEARKNDVLPFRELVAATAESLEYFKLSGAETFLSFSDKEKESVERIFPPAEIICAYAAFEAVIERILGKTDYLMVRFAVRDTIGIRFLLSGQKCLQDLAALKINDWALEYTSEDNDIELFISPLKGGDDE